MLEPCRPQFIGDEQSCSPLPLRTNESRSDSTQPSHMTLEGITGDRKRRNRAQKRPSVDLVRQRTESVSLATTTARGLVAAARIPLGHVSTGTGYASDNLL